MEKTGKALKVWAWIFIVTSVIIPLLGVGSIICSIKYKKYDEKKRGTIITDFYNCSCCSFGVQHH